MKTKSVKVVVIAMALSVLQVFSYSSYADEPRTPISSLPYRITSPGSYYLTKDMQTTVPDQNAIEILADSVTIDLMGYNLIGTDSGNGCGIFMNGRKNIEIRNGTVWNFGGDGIYEAKYPTEADLNYGAGHRVIGYVQFPIAEPASGWQALAIW